MARTATDVERRGCSAATAGLALRAAESGAPTFYGHPAVVNVRTAIGNPLTWGFYEEIAAGAFDDTLKDDDQRFLVDHETSMIVSRASAGDLRVSMDDVGPVFDSDLDQEVSYIRDLTHNVRARRITGMSIGFTVPSGGDTWSSVDVTATDEKGNEYVTQAELRTINRLELWEGSAVTFPAYDETDAALRALRSNPDGFKRRESLLKRAPRQLIDRGVLGRALDLMAELRAGKMLSQANMDLLQGVLDTLAAADELFDPFVSAVVAVDDALDQAQQDVSGLLGVPDPDANDPDEGADDGQRSVPGPVPAEDYLRAFAARHGLRL